jgi:glycosyltransferase involved in cell wall biosynthesis
MSDIQVSYVLTVYNKAEYLPFTLASFRQQTDSMRVEFVFVDDCSTDNSLEIIKHYTFGWQHVVILHNTDNRGPSVRLNQGVRAASGQYVCLMDADDILPVDGPHQMLLLMEKFQADVLYGRWQKPGKKPGDLLGVQMTDQPAYTISYTPLEYVLRGKFIRMTLMVRRDVFLKAGGADERIFIQDESLPLRLAYHARIFIAMHETVILVPDVLRTTLSDNKTQLNHDRFLAYKNALEDFKNVSPKIQHLLYQRAISAAWKHRRAAKNSFLLPSFLTPLFWHYLQVKLFPVCPKPAKLAALTKMFAALPAIRRM